MEIMVDLSGGRVWLEGWEDFGGLALSARTERPGEVDDRALDALSTTIESAGAGWMEAEGYALVMPDSLRRLATEAAEEDGLTLGPDWEDGFASMLEYAADSGWVNDDGAIRAHVEWRDA